MFSWYQKYKDGWIGNVVSIIGGFLIALIIYNSLIFVLGTSTPLVSVFSGSMEHDYFDAQIGYQSGIFGVALEDYWGSYGSWYDEKGIVIEEFKEFPVSGGFKKGDMLIVVKGDNLNVGDVIVFDSGYFSYPIIHRIVEISDEGIKTKGDHNPVADSWVLTNEQVYGKAVVVIPFVGWVKVLFSEMTGLM